MYLDVSVYDKGCTTIRVSKMYELMGLNWYNTLADTLPAKNKYVEKFEYRKGLGDLYIPLKIARELAYGWFYKSEKCQVMYFWLQYIDSIWNQEENIFIRYTKYSKYKKQMHELMASGDSDEAWRLTISYNADVYEEFCSLADKADNYIYDLYPYLHPDVLKLYT